MSAARSSALRDASEPSNPTTIRFMFTPFRFAQAQA
jgi:hypothetical protein